MNNQEVDCGCDQVQQPLLAMDEALDFLLNAVVVNTNTHTVSLDNSLYQVLAQDVCSTINVPDFDNSAMDGYAINLKEDQVNISGGVNFEVTDRIPAGSIGNTLAPGCAARIFTGAPIPKGANTVIMQEECEVSEDGKSIETWRPLSINENIRPMGNDIQTGDVILRAGMQLKPQDVALAASVGVAELEVFKKLKVGVFFTGDELVEPGNALNSGEIYNSNRYALLPCSNN